MRFLRCLGDFEKWSGLGKSGPRGVKMGKNGVKSLAQNPHIYTTNDAFNALNRFNYFWFIKLD